MKKGLVGLLILCIASCIVPKTNKQYTYQGVYGVASSFEFYDDCTFEYYWIMGLIWDTTRGTWTKQNGKIYITSKYQPEGLSSYTISSASNASDSITVIVFCDSSTFVSNWYFEGKYNGETIISYANEPALLYANSVKLKKPIQTLDSITITSFCTLGSSVVYKPPSEQLPDTIWANLKPMNYYVSFQNKELTTRFGKIVYEYIGYEEELQQNIYRPIPFSIGRMKWR